MATVTGNPGVVFSTLFITLVAMLAATSVVSIAVAVPEALRSAFVSNPILVFAGPGATRTEIESLDGRLKALPMVADVSHRSKEVALSALVEAGLPLAPEGRNPLPDVWTVHPRLREEPRADPTFLTAAVGARDAIASLPAVERVKFDDGWVTLLDRWARAWSSWGLPTLAMCLLVESASLMIVYGLSSRALHLPDQRIPGRKKSVLALILVFIVIASTLASYLAATLFISSSVMTDASLLKPIAGQAGLPLLIIVASIGATTLVVAWLGNLAFGSQNSF